MRMNKAILPLVLFLSLVIMAFTPPSDENSIEQRVDQILSKLSLEDKVGEMTQLSIDMLSVGDPYNLAEPHSFDPAKLYNVLVELRVGSILNVGGHAYTREHWEEVITVIQDYATNKKKNGIPILYGIDAIHGTNYTQKSTLFPQQLALASSWNRSLANQQAAVTAYETRASGIPWTFAPVLDIGRDPRWPRLWETFGEDVHLASVLGEEMIQGFQGESPDDPYRIASCMKHFLGYSVTLSGKDRSPAWIPERQLREYFVPTFQSAIDAGAKTIMICSGEMNGVPVHVDPWVLKTLLRDDLGFEGITLTDWEDIGYLVSRHKVAKDMKEAIAMAINAGIDMAMVPMDINFPKQLKELVEEGKVSEERIDEAVRRILKLKIELGLMENNFYDFDLYKEFGGEKHRKIALNAAEESVILLKNEGNILPLKADAKLFVTGPNADILNVLNGGWTGTWQGNDPKYDTPGKHTILEGLKEQFGSGQILYDSIANESMIAQSDVLIAVIGEKPYTEKPGDIDNLMMDKDQKALVNKLAETGKPVVLVMIQGRPRVVQEIVPSVDAILCSFLPGNEGAEALANIISGETVPSGKLPITYPLNPNDRVNYDHKGTDLVYRDFSMNGFKPQWEFGFGLSYTTFKYDKLVVSSTEYKMGDDIEISIDVTNTGALEGKEVVQLFVSDLVASITPPVKRLRGFEKIQLAPGASQTVKFNINTSDLSFVGINNKWVVEEGDFVIRIADQQKNIKIN